MTAWTTLGAMLFVAGSAPVATPVRGGGTVRWNAPDGCPPQAEVARLIDEHAGDESADVIALDADVEVLALADGRWSATLQLRGPSADASTRTLTVGSCEAAAQAVALAVALASSPAPTESEAPDAPEPRPPTVDPAPPTIPEPAAAAVEPGPSRATEPAPPPAEPAAIPRRPPPRVRGFVATGGGIAGGVVPRPTGYVVLEVGVLGRAWQLSARGDYVVRRRARLEQREAGGWLSVFAGGLQGGPVLPVGPLELPLQIGVIAGAIRAVGFGASSNDTRAVPWAAAVANAGLRWSPVPRLAVGLTAEIAVPFVRHTFTLGEPFVIASTGRVGGRGFATIAVRFP